MCTHTHSLYSICLYILWIHINTSIYLSSICLITRLHWHFQLQSITSGFFLFPPFPYLSISSPMVKNLAPINLNLFTPSVSPPNVTHVLMMPTDSESPALPLPSSPQPLPGPWPWANSKERKEKGRGRGGGRAAWNLDHFLWDLSVLFSCVVNIIWSHYCLEPPLLPGYAERTDFFFFL